MEFTVAKAGPLLEVLAAYHPDASKRTLRTMLTQGRVRVDGVVINAAKEEVAAGATILIGPVPARGRAPAQPRPTGASADGAEEGSGPDQVVDPEDALAAAKRARVRVLYEDRDLLVLDKPSGLLSVPLPARKGDQAEDDLTTRAKRYMASVRGASLRARRRAQKQHRDEAGKGSRTDLPRLERGDALPFLTIEKSSSGCVVFTKDQDAHDGLVAHQASEPEVLVHVAAVFGLPNDRQGSWSARVTKSGSRQTYVTTSDRHGREVRIDYEVIETNPWVLHPGRDERTPPTALIRFTSPSRDAASLRALLAHKGHPVLGEDRYADKGRRVPDPARRLLLHAEKVRFMHPFHGTPVTVEAPLPKSFRGDMTRERIRGPREPRESHS